MKKSGIFGGFKEKIKWNFHGSWFLTLEVLWCVTQFCRISNGEKLFSGISKGKVKNLKIPEFGFSENFILNPTILDFLE